jgi:hypothetical protein
MKSWVMTAILASGSAHAAPTLKVNPSLLQGALKPALLNPAILAPFISCSNNNIESVELEPLTDVTYKILVKFKDVVLKESGRGDDHLDCSLYSKVPADFSNTAGTVSIVSSRFEIQTITPKLILGLAHFGVGIVAADGLAFDGDHYLMPGVAAGLEGQSRVATGSSAKPMMLKADSSQLTKSVMLKSNSAQFAKSVMLKANSGQAKAVRPDLTRIARDRIFLPVNLINIADLFTKLPKPLILETTTTRFGDTESRSNETRTIDVEFVGTQAVVEDGQYIVNQFGFSIFGEKGDKNASAQLKWLEVVLEAHSL